MSKQHNRNGSAIRIILGFILPILSLLVVILLLQIRWSPGENLVGVDSGFFAYVGRQLLKGERLYVDIFDTKSPGIYYINSLALSLLGDNLWSIWIFQGIWASITAMILFLVMRTWVRPLFAWVSTFFFLFTLYYPDYYMSGNLTEFYALLPQVLGLAAISAFSKTRKGRWLVLLGAATGLAIQFKLTYVGVGLAGSLAVGLDAFLSRQGRRLVKYAILVLMGFLAPVLVMVLFAASQGILEELWYSTFIYNVLYSQHGFSVRNLYGTMRKLFLAPPLSYLSALAVGASGSYFAAFFFNRDDQAVCRDTPTTKGRVGIKQKDREIFWAAIFWGLVVEWGLVFVSGRFLGHYFITPLPVMAAGCAFLLNSIPTYLGRFRTGDAGSGAVLAMIAVLSVAWSVEVAVKDLPSPEQARRIAVQYDRRETAHDPVVEYIMQHTDPEDLIYIWDDHPEYYYLSGRESPTRFLYATQLLLPGDQSDEWFTEHLRDLDEDPPVLILTQHDTGGRVPYLGGERGSFCWMCAPGIEEYVIDLKDFVEARYDLVDEIGPWVIYRLHGVQDYQ